MTDMFGDRYVKNKNVSYLYSSAHSIDWLNKSLLSNHVLKSVPRGILDPFPGGSSNDGKWKQCIFIPHRVIIL